MNVKKLKKVVLPVLSLCLATMLAVMNVHATQETENESVGREQGIPEQVEGTITDESGTLSNDLPVEGETAPQQETENAIDKKVDGREETQYDHLLDELILNDVDFNEFSDRDIDNFSVYTYPIPVGTSSDSVIGYIIVKKDGQIYGLVELTGDMLEGFNSSEVGKKYYSVRVNDKKSLHSNIEIRENTDINDVGKIVDIDINIGSDWEDAENVLQQADDFNPQGFEWGGAYIDLLDNLGGVVYSIPFDIKEYIPDFNVFGSLALGKHTYSMEFKGHPLTFDINIRPTKFQLYPRPFGGEHEVDSPISIPLGGDIRKASVCYLESDAVSGQGWGFGCSGILSNYFEEETTEKIANLVDNTKVGIQEINVTIKEGGVPMSGTIKVSVGMSKKSTVEELLSPEAQASIPNGNQLGVWDVPSGEAGAGTWTFQTDLAQGKGATVWSFHNEEWLKIGVYTVGVDGIVTVLFTADQLSPVLLTEYEGSLESNSGPVLENDAVSDNNSSADSSSTSGNGSISATPNTGDKANSTMFTVTTLLGLVVLGATLFMKRKKISL